MIGVSAKAEQMAFTRRPLRAYSSAAPGQTDHGVLGGGSAEEGRPGCPPPAVFRIARPPAA